MTATFTPTDVFAELNVAVADIAEFMVTEHVPVPEHAPPQPAKREPGRPAPPEDGVGVSVTTVPVLKLAVQVPGQLIPVGMLVTVPLPVPARVAVSE
jgi:hypothetical protein